MAQVLSDALRVEFGYMCTPLTSLTAITWTDVTSSVMLSEGVTFNRGRFGSDTTARPGSLSFTLDNSQQGGTEGRFTIGGTNQVPGLALRIPVRVRARYPYQSNLVGNSSFEGNVLGWDSYLARATLSRSTTRASSGSASLLATWAASAAFAQAATTSVATVIGRRYTASMSVYVPTGSPDVYATALFVANGSTVTTKDAWVTTSVTFTATSTSTSIGIQNATSATAGQTCYIDGVVCEEGSTATPYASSTTSDLVPLWLGYVESFETEWDNGYRAVVKVSASDRLARLEKRKLPSLIRGAQLRSYTPVALWPLTESEGTTTCGDTSGSNAPSLTVTASGTGTPSIVFGSSKTAPGPDDLTAAVITPSGSAPFTNGYSLTIGSSITGLPSPWSTTGLAFSTISCYFYVAAAATRSGLLSFGGTGFRSPVGIRITAADKIEATGLSTITGTTTITGGVWHHVALTQSVAAGSLTTKLYLDGVLEGTSTNASTTTCVGNTFNAAYDSTSGQYLSGRISHVALYAAALVGSTITEHAAVRDTLSSYTAEAPDTKFARLVKIAGLTSTDYGFAYGSSGVMSSTMTPFPVADRPLLEALNECAVAEASTVYLDASGVLTLSSRDDRYNVASSFTLPAAAIEKNTTFTSDMSFVVNDVTVARPAGATSRTVNATSVASYDTHDQSITAYVGSDQQAIDMASYLANINSQPYPRVSNIGVDLVTAAAVVDEAAILAAEVGTRFTVSGLPTASTPATVLSWFVEGVTDTVNSTSWKRTFVGTQINTSNTAWLLDTSVLDASTVLGF